MKKAFVWLLIAAILSGLCACSSSTKDPARAAADDAIAALPYLDDLTVEDEPLVKAAREAVDALGTKDRDSVMDHNTVSMYESRIESLVNKAKREDEDAAAEAQRSSMIKQCVGTWKNLYSDNSYRPSEFTLNENMSCMIDNESGEWNLWDNGTISANTFSYNKSTGNLKLMDEMGRPRLLDDDNNIYVPADEYKELHDKMFLTVEITPKNFFDYFGNFKMIGYTLDDWGNEKSSVWFTPSVAIGNGLVLWSVSDDFSIQYTYSYSSDYGNYSSSSTSHELPLDMSYSNNKNMKITSIDNTKGSVTFIRSEYVISNTYNEENYNHRQLTLRDGTIHFFSWPWYNPTSFSYNDCTF